MGWWGHPPQEAWERHLGQVQQEMSTIWILLGKQQKSLKLGHCAELTALYMFVRSEYVIPGISNFWKKPFSALLFSIEPLYLNKWFYHIHLTPLIMEFLVIIEILWTASSLHGTWGKWKLNIIQLWKLSKEILSSFLCIFFDTCQHTSYIVSST